MINTYRLGHGQTANVFLVPMHSGIWTLCIDLEDSEIQYLANYGFPQATKCLSYMSPSINTNARYEYGQRGDYQMVQNPRISKKWQYFVNPILFI